MNMKRLARVAAALGMVCGWPATGAGVAAEPTLAEEAAFRRAADHVASAVVRIEPLPVSAGNAGEGEAIAGRGPSTGLIVAEGRIVTTAFAVPDDVDGAIVVLPDGGRRAATVRGRDVTRGLVLLAAANLPDAVPLEAVPRSELRPGQWAIAVGRGWDAASPSLAVGIVSAVNRAWGLGVQTDASVSPMNYGGPLVDIAGRVIGVLSPLPADTAGMNDGVELYDAGIGFAVPLEDIMAALARLDAGESLAPGILGIGYRSRDAINGEPVIASVRAGSPAAEAGLRPGDRIVRIAGRDVTRIADARHATAARYAGDLLPLAVSRTIDGEEKTIETTATLVATLPPWRRAVVGLVIEPSTDGDDDAGQGGAEVAWVLPDGPAAKAGLEAGDRLVALATAADAPPTPIDSVADAAGMLAGLEPGQSVRVSFTRGDSETTVELATIPLPAEIPAEGPPGQVLAVDPLAGPQDPVDVVRLEAAEVAEPPLAVIPRGSGPVGLLIWCGTPRGPVADDEAAAWRLAAGGHGIAVILAGSGDPASWRPEDTAGIVRAIATLNRRRPVDPARVGIAGSGAGAAFAWLAAERIGRGIGVALVDAGLPRRAKIEPASPGSGRWVLLGPGADEATRRRVADDRARLERAGHAAGLLPDDLGTPPPAELLCRWAAVLGLL